MANQACPRVAMAAVAFTCVLAGGSASAGSGHVRGQVVGQVTGLDGRPLEGVTATAGAATAITGPGGLYTLEGVAPGARVVVTFSKAGYATTWGAVELPVAGHPAPSSDRRPTVTIDGCNTGLGNRVRHGRSAMDVFLECGAHARKPWHLLGCLAEPRFVHRVDGFTWKTLKQSLACVRMATFPLEELEHRPTTSEGTLHQTLLAAAPAVTLDAASGGTVERDGFKVTFPAGSIDAAGAVEVALSPLDVTTPALSAFPGDFRGTDSSLDDALLEAWGEVGVSLTQGGRPVPLVALAALEVPLPASSPFEPGDRVPLWSFDEAKGFFVEQFPGDSDVGSSTSLPGRYAAFGPLSHAGHWSVAGKSERACLCGTVEDARGRPVAGARVTATGLDHFAVTAARSGHDGFYCVDARRGSRVSVRASAVADGLRKDTAAVEVEAPLAAARCHSAGCGAGPVLVLPETSCVCGRTLDASGQPVPGVAVATSAGSAAVAGPDGGFCLGAPAGQRVTVFAPGYPPATVETPPGAASDPGGCAVVDLVPAAPQTTCVSGRVVAADGLPIALATVEAQDALGRPYGPPVTTDALGLYSLGGLPTATGVRIRATGLGCFALLPSVVTGETPGEPGSAACTRVQDAVCLSGPA